MHRSKVLWAMPGALASTTSSENQISSERESASIDLPVRRCIVELVSISRTDRGCTAAGKHRLLEGSRCFWIPTCLERRSGVV